MRFLKTKNGGLFLLIVQLFETHLSASKTLVLHFGKLDNVVYYCQASLLV